MNKFFALLLLAGVLVIPTVGCQENGEVEPIETAPAAETEPAAE